MRFKLFGVEIECSFPAAALTTLAVLLDSRHTIEVCMLAAFIHEIGHITAMFLCGSRPKVIKIGLFAVDISDPSRGARGLVPELLIVFAGIIANFLSVFGAWVLFALTGAQYFMQIAAASLITACFNLLPAATLDGGQGLFFVLMRRFSYKAAEAVINILTVILLIPFSVAGITVLFRSKNNFSLLIISVYLILSLVLKKEYF